MRLLGLTDAEEIGAFLSEMKQDAKQLRQLIVRICWHMRGSVSREEGWTLSHEERRDILELIDENRETTEKTGLPLM